MVQGHMVREQVLDQVKAKISKKHYGFLENFASIYGPIHNLKEFSNSNILQAHIWNAHCSRSMFAICSCSSMLFKYGPGPGVYLT